jgi:hypothetical protein
MAGEGRGDRVDVQDCCGDDCHSPTGRRNHFRPRTCLKGRSSTNRARAHTHAREAGHDADRDGGLQRTGEADTTPTSGTTKVVTLGPHQPSNFTPQDATARDTLSMPQPKK